MSMPSGIPVRMLAFVVALALSALLPALYLSTPAHAQNVVRDDIVRITDVFSGTQASSVVIVLEYPTNTFDENGDVVVAYPYLYLRLCNTCNWRRADAPTSPKKVYDKPNQVQVRVSLPQLCPSTDYGMDVAIHRENLSNPLPTDFTPDSTPHGFGFPSVEGATIGTISGTVDMHYCERPRVHQYAKAIHKRQFYLHYRVYNSGDLHEDYEQNWENAEAQGRNEVEFTLIRTDRRLLRD